MLKNCWCPNLHDNLTNTSLHLLLTNDFHGWIDYIGSSIGKSRWQYHQYPKYRISFGQEQNNNGFTNLAPYHNITQKCLTPTWWLIQFREPRGKGALKMCWKRIEFSRLLLMWEKHSGILTCLTFFNWSFCCLSHFVVPLRQIAKG